MKSGLHLGAKLWWGAPVLLVILWAAGAFAVETFPGLASTPIITIWLLPFAGFARDIAAAITVGAVVVGTVLGGTSYPRVLRWASIWALVWLISLIVLLTSTMSDIFAVAPTEVLAPVTWWRFLLDVSIGRVFLFQLIAVAVVGFACLFVRSRSGGWIIAATALGASAATAFLGHGGLHTAQLSATISLSIHIAAISLWIGGLAVLVAFVSFEPASSSVLMPRFSLLALWCVIIVAESGLLNATLRVGDPSQFVGTLYGVLILVKAVLLGVLVRLGWLRQKVVGDIGNTDQRPLSLLARYASWELIAMGAAIALSVALSRIGPSPVRVIGGDYLPLATVMLALAVPLLLVWSFPQRTPQYVLGRRPLVWLREFPQLPAVLLLIAVAEVAGVGLFELLLGVELGVIFGSLILVVIGYVWASSVVGTRSVVGIALVMVGWPVVMWLVSIFAVNPLGWKGTWLSVLVAEALLTMLLVRWSAGAERVPANTSTMTGGSSDRANPIP